MGRRVGFRLLHTIARPKISFTIFSESCGASKRCLRELVRMAADGKSAGHVVVPFFDGVERSHAPHLTGSFREAFRSQEMCFEQRDVEAGQQALGDVSFLKGWAWQRIVNGHRGEFVRIVVGTDPSEFRQGFRIDVPESLVGNDDHIKKITGLLDTTSNGTPQTIGIYGMGGIGKIAFTFGEFALQEIVDDSSR